MRNLFASFVFGLSVISTPVLALPDWIIPSPITIAVQVGRWILSQDTNEEVYYVRVQATGDTESQARTEAFRLAVDQAVGSLLVSETEIQNGNIARHDVINYNSGYVHDFEYVNIHRDPGKVTLQIDVYVSKSKIAERLTVQGETAGELQGGRIAEAFKSIQREHQTGDQVLQAVLSDFPHKAIDVNNINVEYTNPNRQPTLNVSFEAQWNPKYLTALKEALANTMQPVHAKQLRNNGVVFFDHKCIWSCYDAFTSDENRFGVVYHGMMETSSPMLEVTLLDVHQTAVYQECYALYQNLYQYRMNWTIEIRTKVVSKQDFTINLSKMNISQLDKVDLKIIPYKQCNL